ncbi:MAG TPA: hypothetical protein VNO20_11655 [Solirubrobacterales bacterium]|nr:hypothetical protein [Solirubrobacterales bacterium]
MELKRQHGAADSELQQLEDEAFGQAERPGAGQGSDTAAEAPTEFMSVPEAGEKPQQRQEPSVADLQEAPPPPEPADEELSDEEAPVEEEDREAIAEQPTEHFDVEEELAAAESNPGPSDEELVEEEISEPRLAPVDPLANMEAVEEIEVEATPEAELEDDDEEDEFWSDQRLSEELDQALDAPLPEEPQPAAEAEETAPPAEEDDEDAPAPSGGSAADHDVLEDTPDFLEDAPEDDELWFEQKPPKDFDFDD